MLNIFGKSLIFLFKLIEHTCKTIWAWYLLCGKRFNSRFKSFIDYRRPFRFLNSLFLKELIEIEKIENLASTFFTANLLDSYKYIFIKWWAKYANTKISRKKIRENVHFLFLLGKFIRAAVWKTVWKGKRVDIGNSQ